MLASSADLTWTCHEVTAGLARRRDATTRALLHTLFLDELFHCFLAFFNVLLVADKRLAVHAEVRFRIAVWTKAPPAAFLQALKDVCVVRDKRCEVAVRAELPDLK